MLRAVRELSEEDITDDARELYGKLRRSFSRLDEIPEWQKLTDGVNLSVLIAFVHY